MNKEMVEKLNKKLESTVLFLEQLRVDKKSANANFKEQMKQAEKRMQCLAQALQSGDQTHLITAFSQFEIDAFANK